jgi:glycosyltransferase involved in cell wall biosynthesis
VNIKIITDSSFPVGLASANRIMSYAKGLVKNNCNVTVICLIPTESPDLVFNSFISGHIDGVNYSYPSGRTIRNKYFLKRRIDNTLGIFKTFFTLLFEEKDNKTDVIIYYATSTFSALLLFVVSRIRRIIFLKEESELPHVYLIKNHYIRNFLFKQIHYLLFDGFLLMTKRLEKYFKEENNLSTPCIHIPMTVDFDRFNNIEKKGEIKKYIAYCGTLNNAKDGVDILINAFGQVAKDFPELYLYLIGECVSKEVCQSYTSIIETQQLTEKVIFTGRVNKDAIPVLLCNATILALARPSSLQAEGGFPTKLGEYLATGIPTIVSRVGEIPDYFTDEVDIFMVEPGSVESLTNKIKEILKNYNFAMEVAGRGKAIALDHFNYNIQIDKLINFIKSLK